MWLGSPFFLYLTPNKHPFAHSCSHPKLTCTVPNETGISQASSHECTHVHGAHPGAHIYLSLVFDRVKQSVIYMLSSLCFQQLFLPCSVYFILNKIKWNQIQIWFDCYKRTFKYALFQGLHFPSQISHLALPQRWNTACQVFLRHTFFQRDWKQLFCCQVIKLGWVVLPASQALWSLHMEVR